MTTGTEGYYARRAAEYDRVYAKPERQADIARLGEILADTLADHDVLEVAAGTGFWTERYADGARSVTACDVNEEPLAVARSRRRWPEHTTFATADAFALDRVPDRFDAAYVGYFWSHLTLDQLDGFLAGLIRRVEPGATFVIVDNRYVEGSNLPVTRTDAAGNTYQQRRLNDGTEWEVLKNFPSPDEVEAALARHGAMATVSLLDHYWVAVARTPAPGYAPAAAAALPRIT